MKHISAKHSCATVRAGAFSSLALMALLALGHAAPLHAAPAESAAAAKKSPYPVIVVAEAELDSVRSAAEDGDAAAQVKLGHYYMTHYEEGYANEKTAGEWFHRAAEGGDAAGQAWYAVYLWAMEPGGGEARKAAALPWAEKAAEQGNTIGEYLMGKFTPISERETAIDWFRRAAKKGFVPAQRDLAYVLLWGNHFEDLKHPEVKEAHKWIAKAARSRDCLALMMAGGHPHRSTKNTLEHQWEHPVKKSEKFVKQAIKSALAGEWKWYGAAFGAYENYGRCHGKGGFHNWMIVLACKDLYTLYDFAGREKDAAKVPGQLIALLKKRAKTDPVGANLCLAELLKNWGTLYFPDEPCPEDYTIYAAKAAEAEGTHYDDPRLKQTATGL